MSSLSERLNNLISSVDKAWESLDIDELQTKLEKLTNELSRPEAWNNPSLAQEKSKKVSQLQSVVEPWVILRGQLADCHELIELDDDDLKDEVENQVASLENAYQKLKRSLAMSGKYDSGSAVLRLSAGVGGTDAQDWTEMLERMYLRWADKSAFKTSILSRSAGEEAGIKSVTILVDGAFAYGLLKGENGVHRLVRLSPFNSDNLRQTSFALVEVLPEIDEPEDVVLDEKDLKIDVYRAGGKGGQSVNTTDSAVRITHIPTNITVAIQNERSQLQNKETALKIIRSKLAQLQLEQHANSIKDLRASESAGWGAQIRNYVLHPYTIVKDTRTKHEEKDVQKVLDGDLDAFIESYQDFYIKD